MSERVTELAKRRGFFFGSNEEYGGVAGFYTYGPQGAGLKRNVEDAWRERFTVQEGNIGRRYRRQDEIGTPFCVTVDHEGLEGDDPQTVTIRERDTTAQVRVPVAELASELQALREGDTQFDRLREEYGSVETGVTRS